MLVEAGADHADFFAQPWMDEGAWAAAEREDADDRMFVVLTELGYGDPKGAGDPAADEDPTPPNGAGDDGATGGSPKP